LGTEFCFKNGPLKSSGESDLSSSDDRVFANANEKPASGVDARNSHNNSKWSTRLEKKYLGHVHRHQPEPKETITPPENFVRFCCPEGHLVDSEEKTCQANRNGFAEWTRPEILDALSGFPVEHYDKTVVPGKELLSCPNNGRPIRKSAAKIFNNGSVLLAEQV
jgi:hypothetical protein